MRKLWRAKKRGEEIRKRENLNWKIKMAGDRYLLEKLSCDVAKL